MFLSMLYCRGIRDKLGFSGVVNRSMCIIPRGGSRRGSLGGHTH